MKTEIYNEILQSHEWLKRNNLLPNIPVIECAHSPIVTVGGKEYILFSSNSYLGLNVHPRVVKAAKSAIDTFGTGGGNSRLLGGTLSIHRDLEQTIGWFKHTPDSVIFPAGFMVNAGIIPALVKVFSLDPSFQQESEVIIFSDELNHASIIMGCKLSGAKIIKYLHCDVDDLRKKINELPKGINKLIITDGVFSLDGDVAPLDKIVEIAKSNNAMVMVDDAHGTGVLGNTGRGIVEYFNLRQDDVDISMGTFSKALASAGGFVTGDQGLVDYLKVATRTYLFTASIPPSVAATVIEALHVIDEEPELITNVLKNALTITNTLANLGFNVMKTQTPVIPVLIGDEKLTMAMSKNLFTKGIIASAVRYPAVPKNSARLRLTASALHKEEHLHKLFDTVKEIGEDLHII